VQLYNMLVTVIFIGLVGGSLGDKFGDTVPVVYNVIEYSHSAKITVDPATVPEGTDRVHIKSEEVNDLTGNMFESGYDFGYNAAVPYFYYPQLNSNKYHVFKLSYGKSDGNGGVSWTRDSEQTKYAHSEQTRFSLVNMKRSWPSARDACLEDKKRLAVITNSQANNMVLGLLRKNKVEAAWIGLYDSHYIDDSKTVSKWKWVDQRTPFKFSNFELGAVVDKSTLDSSSAAIEGDEGEWETRKPTDKLVFVCEEGKKEKPKISESLGSISEVEIMKAKRE